MSDYNNNFFQQTPKKETDNWMASGTGNQQNTPPFSSSVNNIFSQDKSSNTFTTSQFGSSITPISQNKPSLFSSSGNNVSFGSNPSNFSNQPFTTLSGQFGMSPANPPFGAAQQNQFGTQQQGIPNWTNPISSNWSSTSKGSKITPYSSTRIKEDTGIFADLLDITGMKEYSSLSVDEIRKDDYEMSFKPPKSSSSFSPSTSGLSSNLGALAPKPTLSPGSGFGGIGFSSSTPGMFGTSTPSTPVSTFGTSLQPQLFSSTTSKPFSSTTTPTTCPFGTSGLQFNSFGNTQSSQPPQPPQTSPFSPLSTQPFTSTNSMQQSSFSTQQSSQPQLFGAPVQPQKPFFGAQSTEPFNSTMNQPQPFTSSSQQLSTTPQLQFNSTQTTQPFNSSLLTNQPFGTGAPTGATSGIFGGGNTLFGSKPSGESTMFTPSTLSSSFQKPQAPAPFAFGNSQQNNSTQSGLSLFNNAPAFGSSSMPQSTLQIQPSQTSNLNMQMSNPNVDLSDPYLIKNINFEKIEYQKPSVKIALPTPIFKTSRDTPTVDLKIRQPKQIHKNMLYTIPDLKDINTVQSISNFVIGFEGKGRVEFLEPVTVNSLEDIEKRISFRNENVEISDPIGCGMNKKARVYVEELYPICRTTNEAIKGKAEKFPEKGIQERFIYQLKNDSSKKFIDYNPDNGVYVYEVNHF